jgi:hypothetical protein
MPNDRIVIKQIDSSIVEAAHTLERSFAASGSTPARSNPDPTREARDTAIVLARVDEIVGFIERNLPLVDGLSSCPSSAGAPGWGDDARSGLAAELAAELATQGVGGNADVDAMINALLSGGAAAMALAMFLVTQIAEADDSNLLTSPSRSAPPKGKLSSADLCSIAADVSNILRNLRDGYRQRMLTEQSLSRLETHLRRLNQSAGLREAGPLPKRALPLVSRINRLLASRRERQGHRAGHASSDRLAQVVAPFVARLIALGR